MRSYPRNPFIATTMLPVDIVLAPGWWHRHAGITFDRDFYFHPLRRVEVERLMERMLYDKWGRYGLGSQRDEERPELGAVHLAAGYLLQEMLGCAVSYPEDGPPQVLPADYQALAIDQDAAFASPAYRDLVTLLDQLQDRHGRVVGDVNWSGVLNLALDLRGQRLFMDSYDQPEAVQAFYQDIGAVIERFVVWMQRATGSSSVSVNRNVRHIQQPVFLHSECSHTMISVADYRASLMAIDAAWSQRHRPFGIHYCGQDPHRFAEALADLPHLDFLDVGWGGDVALLRQHLPSTFLNLRLSPVELVDDSPDAIAGTVRRLVQASGNPWLTGVCCINLDERVGDDKIDAIYGTVEDLRLEYARGV